MICKIPYIKSPFVNLNPPSRYPRSPPDIPYQIVVAINVTVSYIEPHMGHTAEQLV